ncbi:MAG: hypothetical protein P8163_19385 [Candidatus Thiodiazotropha sp.]
MDAKQLHKLNKINELRVRRLEKELAESKVKLLEACDKVVKRDGEIKKINSETGELISYLTHEKVMSSPTKREHVHIRRFWLNYDLEMHEYYYNQEVDEKNEADLNHKKTSKLWNKQKLKTEKLSKIHKSLINADNIRHESMEDEENQESSIK